MDLKIIYGISDLQDSIRKQIEDAITERGGNISSSVCRWNKVAVLHMVDEARGSNKEEVVLIISHRLTGDDPFSALDLISCQEAIPNIRIVFIIDKEEQGSAFLKELYNNGIFNAIYSDDTDVDMIADFVLKGRSATEARRYYGIGSETKARGSLSVEKAVEFVLNAEKEDETHENRLLWIKDKINNDVTFREIINRLPDEIKDSLAADERFETYIAEYIRAKKEAEAEQERRQEKEKELENREKDLRRQQEEARAAQLDARTFVNRALRRMVIGVTGTEHRVGCTHQAILLANYLTAQGFTVALVEHDGMEKKVLAEIIDTVFGGNPHYEGVDYFPDFSMSRISDLDFKKYHFVVVDYGVFREEVREEFATCVQQIVVCGSKPWEVKRVKKVFEIIGKKNAGQSGHEEWEASSPEEYERISHQLQNIDFLFAPTERREQNDIKKALAPLEKIHFASFSVNPFSCEEDDALHAMMEDFLVDVNIGVQGGKKKSGHENALKKIGRKLTDGIAQFKK